MLLDTLITIDPCQARRYNRLAGPARTIAAHVIARHLAACANLHVTPDIAAIREIIDDAREGQAVYAETDWTPRRPPSETRR